MTWAEVADAAIEAFEEADTGAEVVHSYAYILDAIRRRNGWDDPRIPTYLAKVYSLRKPNGGWGLNAAYDVLNNGSVNPASTVYTVTLGDHVGPVLLDAHLHDPQLVPASDIQTIVDLLMGMHQTIWTNAGRCFAYSDQVADKAVTTGCIHNANAAAAWFLWTAYQHGFTAPNLTAVVASVTKCEVSAWTWQTAWWPYLAAGPAGDHDHTSASVELMLPLAPVIARETGLKVMTTDSTHSMTPVAHARLAGLNEEFFALSAQWLSEAAAFVANPPTLRGVAQMARAAARAAERET